MQRRGVTEKKKKRGPFAWAAVKTTSPLPSRYWLPSFGIFTGTEGGREIETFQHLATFSTGFKFRSQQRWQLKTEYSRQGQPTNNLCVFVRAFAKCYYAAFSTFLICLRAWNMQLGYSIEMCEEKKYLLGKSRQRNNYSLLAWFENLRHSTGSSPSTCRACRTSCWSCRGACPSPAACSPSPVCSCQQHAAASQGLCSAVLVRRPPSPCPPPPGSTGSRRGRGWALNPCLPEKIFLCEKFFSVDLSNVPSLLCIQTPWSSIWFVSQL